MAKQKLTYTKALDEIQQIIYQIENEEFSVDELTEKIKHVTELINFCKKSLKQTEEEINKILDDEYEEK